MDIGRRVRNLESTKAVAQSGGFTRGCGKGLFLKKGMYGYCSVHHGDCWRRYDPHLWAGVQIGLEALEYGLPQPDLSNPSPEQVEAARLHFISEGKEVVKDGEYSGWVGVGAATIVEAVRILEELGIDLSGPSESGGNIGPNK